MTESAQHSVQHLEIGARNHQQRLDNFLLSQLKGVPKSRVNKGRKKADYRLSEGDVVRIPPVHMTQVDETLAPAHLLEQVSQSVIFEDAELLVLNKPAGLAVHSGSNIRFGVIEILRQARPNAEMLELVHRLDRETSGCLVIARSRQALNQLHQHFRDDDSDMQKIYRTIVMGRWQGGEQLVDQPLLKNSLRGGERMVEINPQGKPARSLFTPLEYRDRLSLLEVKLFSGRTHQIRVHAQSLGHPVAGDRKYGDNRFNQQLREAGFKRMYLHASRLTFSLGQQRYDIEAPLDAEWQTLLTAALS